MARKKRSTRLRVRASRNPRNMTLFREVLDWFMPEGELLPEGTLHGNTKWKPDQLALQALIWSWQETKFVTDAFVNTQECCAQLSMTGVAKSYTSMMNALTRNRIALSDSLRDRFQSLAEEVGGRYFKTGDWVPLAMDGSRITAPRSVSNEKAFCAPNYGKGKRARYGKKKSKGMRRKRNKQKPPHPQAPQAWTTMIWHMQLRLPWTWRLGPSNASERAHVQDILRTEKIPENTLFCGDAGFVGYPLWSEILSADADFLVRVGGNVDLLSEHADIKKLGGGRVLCWPKGKQNSGDPPLHLRLIQVKVGKTMMWMLTSVLERNSLSKKQIVRLYKLRWGIEVEFRGLKQTIDKCKLRSRNSERLLVELDWSIRAMAIAELIAIRAQIASAEREKTSYDPRELSLANTMRVLRKCMRNLRERSGAGNDLTDQLSRAKVLRYKNRTDKRARYRPKNPDKAPLGDPKIRRINDSEKRKLRKYRAHAAA